MDKIRLPTKLYIDLQDDYDNAVVKVQAMDDFEDIENMTVTEGFEDEDYGEVAWGEFNTVTVTSITPQVATVFEYNPWELFIRLDFRSGILFSPIIISYDIFVTLYVEYLIKPQLSQIKTCIEKMMARFL